MPGGSGAFGEAKPKVARVFEPTLTLADMKEITGISIAAIQKLLDQLIQKKYVERGERDGSWGVFVIQ